MTIPILGRVLVRSSANKLLFSQCTRCYSSSSAAKQALNIIRGFERTCSRIYHWFLPFAKAPTPITKSDKNEVVKSKYMFYIFMPAFLSLVLVACYQETRDRSTRFDNRKGQYTSAVETFNTRRGI